MIVATALALDDPPRAAEQVRALSDIGATRIVHGWRYADAAAFARAAEVLAGRVRSALGAASATPAKIDREEERCQRAQTERAWSTSWSSVRT